ncbi:DUF1573 domain-containing protein [Sphingobacterium multivorum]|uniref:DUF1573 domain-containing protein n=1 Tax=Sphingobacterium multivorum TaxID=28454 RepID=UPI003DA46B18
MMVEKMPLNLLFALTGFLLFSCTNTTSKAVHEKEYVIEQAEKKSDVQSELVFTSDAKYNFGDLSKEDTLIHKYYFKNESSTPLIISSASATCGCTVAHYNKKPILKNQVDSIVAYFVPMKNVLGHQSKTITIQSNAKSSPHLLILYGNVK